MKLPENLPVMITQHLPIALLESLPEPPRETEAEMVAEVTKWVGVIAEKMTIEGGRLRGAIKGCVNDGTLAIKKVAKAAERYREIDVAFREVLIERLDLEEKPELERASIRTFLQDALARDITRDPKGPNLMNYYQRDIGIGVLMALTMVRWPYLRKSHNRASKKVSASYIVCKALSAHKIISIENPKRIVEIYDDLDGIAKRLAGLIQ
jgi:hypothetical protein